MKPLLLTAALCLPIDVLAQDFSIEDVIRDQLQSFNERDVAGAWEHASPFIKGMFGTPENFARMVENGYPMVWDNSDVRFLDRTELESITRQEVQIQGPNGLFYILDYQMIEAPDGWRINGVQVIPVPEAYS
ncbi:DUF4864 domain-containing protein [Octadecabacter ascidiaceicola]|uniref:DUF4864 domain-containing protein n=1 Tax=Octadecabacter ascidiaceicola TaxID=1655543 RepID=A0A238KS03_9RHOB|nr:DUF4864 domain-containing protein [Octadecabacter ascidiaceicola]SMX45440.1 hypothetical protein OCA8868_03299 [Octadecabacter ascidiaceicola]